MTIDPSILLNIDDDIFFTKLRYAAKKDIDSIVQEYISLLGDSWKKETGGGGDKNNNPLLVYFLFGEIIVSASKIAESLGADIKDIIPFSLNRETIEDIINSKDIFYLKVKSLLESLIEYRDSHSHGRYKSVIIKAKEYIEKNYKTHNISLNATAVHVGISPNHLSMLFAKEAGINFIDYLTKVRIDHAKKLLQNTNMKSVDIAIETGFKDPHYFSYIFKKNTGFSPREFKQSNK